MSDSFDFMNNLISIEGDMDDPEMLTHLSEGKYISSFGDNDIETKAVRDGRRLLTVGYQIMPEQVEQLREFKNIVLHPCTSPFNVQELLAQPEVYLHTGVPDNTGTQPQEPSDTRHTQQQEPSDTRHIQQQAIEHMISKTPEDIQIYPLPSEKTKNPPYLLSGKDITVKNLNPVTLIVNGCQAMDKLEISMRYLEEQYKTKGVHPCKNHIEESKMHEKEFIFNLITTPCTYEVIDDHPTALVDMKQELIDDNGNFKFYIMFLCLNSCHRKMGKKIELVLKVFNPEKTLILKEEHIKVRVCKNVKRDYKEHSELATKRKSCSSDDEQVPVKKMHMKVEACHSLAPSGVDPDDPLEEALCKNPLKIQKMEHEIHEDSINIEAGLIDSMQIQQFMADTQPSSSTQQTQQYLFEMPSRDDEIMIVSLIKRLGGKYSSVPNAKTVLGDRNFPSCNSLSHNFPNFVSATQEGNTQLY